MPIVTIGIDLAKNVFAVHGMDATGKAVLVRPSVVRANPLERIASIPACLIGMEACFGAHHWARAFAKFGHTMRLMAPKFVIPYCLSGKRGKNGAADAAAICTAVLSEKTEREPARAGLLRDVEPRERCMANGLYCGLNFIAKNTIQPCASRLFRSKISGAARPAIPAALASARCRG